MDNRKNKKRIYCIIPAYNEEGKIGKVLDELLRYGYGVIVVDDGSTDNTVSEVKRRNVVLLEHAINRGQGAALQTGTDYALKMEAEFLVHFDADGQFLASEISDLIAPLKLGEADIVFGSRFLDKRSDMPVFKREVIMPLARKINKLVMNIETTDPQSGLRAFTAEAAEKLKIKNDGAAHCSEILYKAFKHKLKVKEVPTTVVYNEFGQGIFSGRGRGQGGLRIIRDILIAKLID